ncbi:MAG TPA: YciI family protein [Acidobacteriota bacterium]|nr:YciI family protein [Acidobacteriota bacterium]
MKLIAMILMTSFLAPLAFAQEKKEEEPKFELVTYYLGLLYKGPTRDQSEEESNSIQTAHLKHLESLYHQGILLIAGPLAEDVDLRGIVVLKASSLEEAKSFVDADPAVKAGRLRVELHPWMSQSLDVLAYRPK